MNWADDVDEEVSPDAPKIEERDEGNGIKIITEYRTNPDGKKVKVCAEDIEIGSIFERVILPFHLLLLDYSESSTHTRYE